MGTRIIPDLIGLGFPMMITYPDHDMPTLTSNEQVMRRGWWLTPGVQNVDVNSPAQLYRFLCDRLGPFLNLKYFVRVRRREALAPLLLLL